MLEKIVSAVRHHLLDTTRDNDDSQLEDRLLNHYNEDTADDILDNEDWCFIDSIWFISVDGQWYEFASIDDGRFRYHQDWVNDLRIEEGLSPSRMDDIVKDLILVNDN